jgi:hypothetical protein
MNKKLEQRESLERALVLALNTPDEERAERAIHLAERIAKRMDPVTVERAKANALERADAK